MEAPQAVAPQGLKVLLVTSFEESFLVQDTLPELKRRGVEVVDRFEAKHAERYDFGLFKDSGVELILHMTEVGPHNASYALSRKASAAGIPIRSLSRKKASWDFLPAPLDAPPPSLSTPEAPKSAPVARALEEEPWAFSQETADDPRLSDLVGLLRIVDKWLRSVEMPETSFTTWLDAADFNPKTARLNDCVAMLLAYGLTDRDRIVNALLVGRERLLFARLSRLRKEQIPGLVDGYLARNAAKDATLALPEPKEKPDMQAKVVQMKHVDPKVSAFVRTTSEDIASMKEAVAGQKSLADEAIAAANAATEEATAVLAEVIELRKLAEAHAALKTLIRLGMLSPLEAAEKLFGGAL